MMTRQKQYSIAGLLAAVFFPVWACAEQQASAIGVAPTVVEVSGLPGATIAGDLTVLSTLPYQQTVHTTTRAMRIDEQGTVREETQEQKRDAHQWVHFLTDTASLPSQQEQKIHYTITIPHNQDAGSYTALLFIETHCADQQPQAISETHICVASRIGIPLLVTVDGDTIQRTGAFRIARMPFFIISDVIFTVIHVQNTGSAYFRPAGTASLQKRFSDENVQSVAIAGQRYVLPESEREIPIRFAHGQNIGIYDLVVSLADGNGVVHRMQRPILIIAPHVFQKGILAVSILGVIILGVHFLRRSA